MIQACEKIGKHLGRPHTTIWAVIRRLRPTTGIAGDYIKANAFKLAHRIVQHASVEQSIDILSRPNIGVLEPIKKGEVGGGGFYLSVQSDSCGAVKVGVAMPGSGPAPQLTGAVNEQETSTPIEPELIDVKEDAGFFGRGTRRALAEGSFGKGNPLKRGDARRPNRGAGILKSKKGTDGQAQSRPKQVLKSAPFSRESIE